MTQMKMARTKTASSLEDDNVDVGALTASTRVYAASRTLGVSLLTTPDQFVNSQSRFDRESRLSVGSGIVDAITLRELYLSFVGNQVMSWAPEEVGPLKTIVASMADKYQQLGKFPLPSSIYLVKTTGQEAGHSQAYTRQLDTVVLTAYGLASLSAGSRGDALHPPLQTTALENLLIHETFHVFSKNAYQSKPALLAELYADIGYRFTGNDVAVPDVPWPTPASTMRMPDCLITNPDSPRLNTYIELPNPAQPGSSLSLTPILIANEPYRGGEFFDYLHWYLMQIEQDQAGQWQASRGPDGRPIVYPMSPNPDAQMKDEYLDKIGRNLSHEIFQADEVLAQNLVLLVNQPPSAWLLDRMRQQLGAACND